MIGRLRGTLAEKQPPHLILDVNGVGYEVEVPMTTLYRLPSVGEPVTLHTHLVVREDAHLLYGFAEKRERELFRELIRLNGVGPKLALALMSGLEVDELVRCVQAQDTSTLVKIPGVGKKTAERLVLELKGKISADTEGLTLSAAPGDNRADVAAALTALGYSEREANAAAKKLAPDVSVSAGIREALKSLAR